jgi:hypothetical protein
MSQPENPASPSSNSNSLSASPRQSTLSTTISGIASRLLSFSPSAYLHSWLLYLGVQTHVRSTIGPELKPLHNVCEYLNALHIYAEDARKGMVRSVPAHHYCSHVGKGKFSRQTARSLFCEGNFQ